eukprot:6467473-Amphidinium_carterae.1
MERGGGCRRPLVHAKAETLTPKLCTCYLNNRVAKRREDASKPKGEDFHNSGSIRQDLGLGVKMRTTGGSTCWPNALYWVSKVQQLQKEGGGKSNRSQTRM